MIIRAIVLFIFCFGFFTVLTSQAQFDDSMDYDLSDPLEPGNVKYPSYLGVELALGQSLQSGDLQAEFCDCLPFKDGTGLRFDIGMKWEDFLNRKFVYGFGIGYSATTFSSAYQEVVDREIIDRGQVIAIVPVRTQQNMSASFSAISFQPFLKYYPIKRIWVRLGLRSEYIIGSKQEQSLDLLQRKATNREGNEFEISFDGGVPLPSQSKVVTPTRAIIQESEFASLQALQLGIVPALGIDFRIGRRVLLGPNVQLNMPFTGYSSQSTSFRLMSFQAGLDISIRLGTLNSAPPKK